MSDQLDPEIAGLLEGLEEYTPKETSRPSDGRPDFSSLFRDEASAAADETGPGAVTDLTKKNIEVPARMEEEKPASWFADPEFYKKTLAGEGDEAQRVHTVLTKFIQATDPQDRTMYRQNLTAAYWNLASKVAQKLISPQMSQAKQLMLRFGVLHPNLFTSEIRDILHRVVFKKTTDEPFFYLDEWLREVALGRIGPSTSDDVKYEKRDDRSRFSAILAKSQGKRENAEGVMRAKAGERRSLETLLRERVEAICSHSPIPEFQGVDTLYADGQKKFMSELSDILKRMLAADKELQQTLRDCQNASDELVSMKEKLDAMGADTRVDLAAFQQEFGTVKNMAKICVGRQGNHFPILAKEYFHGGLQDVATRENLAKWMAWLETVDIEAYYRPYKTTMNRIVPYVIIVPCYGDAGFCWEPFDIHNRATSRGRIAVPLYPKNLQMAIVYAIADLRWTTAKEKSSYLWMEEGLTGNYYQNCLSKKFKGDVKEAFVSDYVAWIFKESQGIQKLDRDIRSIFWRYIPFSQETKDRLKLRSPVYNELCQKDSNRAVSQGY
ncbi:MAG: hypothetical protein NT080_02115 [Spirochaetes bacterium]|nr:hypothetical protein [Spirochaetota bacterium]